MITTGNVDQQGCPALVYSSSSSTSAATAIYESNKNPAYFVGIKGLDTKA